MLKKALSLFVVIALSLTLCVFAVNALEDDRDQYFTYNVKGGNVSTIDELIEAFSDTETGEPYAVKHDALEYAIVLTENVKVTAPIVIKDGVFAIYGNSCTIFRGNAFDSVFVLNGESSAVYPELDLKGDLTIDGMCDKYDTNNGLIHSYGRTILRAEKVKFVNSTSKSEYGGAICAKTIVTDDNEATPLSAFFDFKECEFENCSANIGGAIAMYAVEEKADGYYKFESCTFKNNQAFSGTGGAISCSSGTLYLDKCTFENNTAVVGGAVYATGGLYDDSSVYQNNTATLDGGAIYSNSILSLENCIINKNVAGQNGGAIYSNGKTTVKSIYSAENVAGQNGGALYLLGKFEFVSGNLMNNEAKAVGGAIYLTGLESYIEMTDGEIAGNKAKFCGGIYCVGDFRIIQGIIGNSTSESPHIYVDGQLTLDKNTLILRDTIGLQVGQYEGNTTYPIIDITTNLSGYNTFKVAYVDMQTSGDNIEGFKNVTKAGICVFKANPQALEQLMDIVGFEKKGIFSYELDENGELIEKCLSMPVWLCILLLIVIVIVIVAAVMFLLYKKGIFADKKKSNKKKKK